MRAGKVLPARRLVGEQPRDISRDRSGSRPFEPHARLASST